MYTIKHKKQKEVNAIQEHSGYALVISFLCIDDMKYITYGISGPGVRFSDVSVDKAKVQKMIERLNEGRIEPCHFMDFIEDELV